MHIVAKDVTHKVIVQIKMDPEHWDTRGHGAWGWRLHMAQLLNLRVRKLAEQCNAEEFFTQLNRFSQEIGFGEQHIVARVTEMVYNVQIEFERSEQEGG